MCYFFKVLHKETDFVIFEAHIKTNNEAQTVAISEMGTQPL